MDKRQIDQKLQALASTAYRQKFQLHQLEQDVVAKKGLPVIRQRAFELIAKRLAPARPYKDGKQTPYRGHPVFVAQHATATCCRSCLARWHHIPKGRELVPEEQRYVVDVIEAWIQRHS
jgi:hypothetical protein